MNNKIIYCLLSFSVITHTCHTMQLGRHSGRSVLAAPKSPAQKAREEAASWNFSDDSSQGSPILVRVSAEKMNLENNSESSDNKQNLSINERLLDAAHALIDDVKLSLYAIPEAEKPVVRNLNDEIDMHCPISPLVVRISGKQFKNHRAYPEILNEFEDHLQEKFSEVLLDSTRFTGKEGSSKNSNDNSSQESPPISHGVSRELTSRAAPQSEQKYQNLVERIRLNESTMPTSFNDKARVRQKLTQLGEKLSLLQDAQLDQISVIHYPGKEPIKELTKELIRKNLVSANDAVAMFDNDGQEPRLFIIDYNKTFYSLHDDEDEYNSEELSGAQDSHEEESLISDSQEELSPKIKPYPHNQYHPIESKELSVSTEDLTDDEKPVLQNSEQKLILQLLDTLPLEHIDIVGFNANQAEHINSIKQEIVTSIRSALHAVSLESDNGHLKIDLSKIVSFPLDATQEELNLRTFLNLQVDEISLKTNSGPVNATSIAKSAVREQIIQTLQSLEKDAHGKIVVNADKLRKSNASPKQYENNKSLLQSIGVPAVKYGSCIGIAYLLFKYTNSH